MNIISRKKLVDFWNLWPQAKSSLQAWHSEAKNAKWKNPNDIKRRFASASFLSDERVVFNIGGNKFRLIVRIRYQYLENNGTIFIRFIGTHAEYDRIDAHKI